MIGINRLTETDASTLGRERSQTGKIRTRHQLDGQLIYVNWIADRFCPAIMRNRLITRFLDSVVDANFQSDYRAPCTIQRQETKPMHIGPDRKNEDEISS